MGMPNLHFIFACKAFCVCQIKVYGKSHYWPTEEVVTTIERPPVKCAAELVIIMLSSYLLLWFYYYSKALISAAFELDEMHGTVIIVLLTIYSNQEVVSDLYFKIHISSLIALTGYGSMMQLTTQCTNWK
ncbi:hypothetical protein ACJX0J_033417, partial [Zea mays]